MDCWAFLELHEGADERAIKRSYAKLLKIHRPDGDLAAFQRLREAYELALAISQGRVIRVIEQPIVIRRPPVHSEPWVPIQLKSAQAPVRSAVEQLDGVVDKETVIRLWNLALEQDCAKAFEKRLLERCISSSPADVSIVEWAVRELGWLTGLQKIRIIAMHRKVLINALSEVYSLKLEEHLKQNNENVFFDLMTRYSQMPWIVKCDDPMVLQTMVFKALQQTECSFELLLRLTDFFQWKPNNNFGLNYLPREHFIHKRLQPIFFLRHLKQLAMPLTEQRLRTSLENAAYLFMTPQTQSERIAFTSNFKNADWQACEDLNDYLEKNYQTALAMSLVNQASDWQSIRPRLVTFADGLWIVITTMWLCFCGALYVRVPTETAHNAGTLAQPLNFTIFLGIFSGIVIGGFLITVNIAWPSVIRPLLKVDNWLTDLFIPKHRNTEPHWRVLHNGVPLLASFSVAYWWSGVIGTGLYIVLKAIRRIRFNKLSQTSTLGKLRAYLQWSQAIRIRALALQISILTGMAVTMTYFALNYPFSYLTSGFN